MEKISQKSVFGKIAALAARGMDFGTTRTRRMLDALGGPDGKLKIIHIAGTNGKGSTAEYVTRILVAAGRRTGTFSSPEVYSYFEQFRIDGKTVERRRLAQCFLRAYEVAESLGATRFEAETAGALLAFAESGCEYAVVECGLGGLNDATNAVNKKELAIITSIGLEHTSVLGGTLEGICAHKAGIIKNCPALVNAYQCGEVKKYFENTGAFFCVPSEISERGFTYGGERYRIKMYGEAQAYNAACAVEAARRLNIGADAIRKGIESTELPGRCEVIKKDRIYILDGAHNPQSFLPLSDLLKKYADKKITVIYGCLSDKDAAGCLKILSSLAQSIIAVPTRGVRACGARETLEVCKKLFKNARCEESAEKALNTADGEVIAVCGTFTILKEAKQAIRRRSYGQAKGVKSR